MTTPDFSGYMAGRVFSNGRIAAISRHTFGHAAIVSAPDAERWGWGVDDRWTYDSTLHAAAALLLWDGEGEPKGWTRHQPSGRRRPDGDPMLEEVRP